MKELAVDPCLPVSKYIALVVLQYNSGVIPVWLVQQSIINRQQSTGLETCRVVKVDAVRFVMLPQVVEIVVAAIVDAVRPKRSGMSVAPGMAACIDQPCLAAPSRQRSAMDQHCRFSSNNSK